MENNNKKISWILLIICVIVFAATIATVKYTKLQNAKQRKAEIEKKISEEKDKDKDKDKEKENIKEEKTETDKKPEKVAKEEEDKYSKYHLDSDKFYEKVRNGDKFVVDFYASWCGPCQYMEPIIKEAIDEGIEVYKVNVDEEELLSYKYGIRALPTMLVIDGDKVIKSHLGISTKEDIKKLYELTK